LGCQATRPDIQVLGDNAPQEQGYVINGGPGSTEIVYRDAKGNRQSASSNVVRVPIKERCVEEPKAVLVPVPVAEVETPLLPWASYTLEVNTLQNYVLASASKLPDVVYHTEFFIPRKPPNIELKKSSDEQVLCCDKQLTFRLHFKNIGGDDAYNISISDIVPARVEYAEGSANASSYIADIQIERGADQKAKKIVWNIEGPIAAGEEGEVSYTVTCPVNMPNLSCFVRFEPKLILKGQQGKIICSVTNKGNGVAKNARLTVDIPLGIEHEGVVTGKRLLLVLGDIEPNKTASKDVQIKMNSDVKLEVITASVVADNWEGCECVVPFTPSLMIEKSGPAETKNRTPLNYTIVVKNISSKNAPATNCILTDKLPPLVTFASATENGVYDSKSNSVTWKLGTLMPGDIVSRNVVVAPQKSGTYIDEAKVSCDEGITVNDKASTLVTGVAAMLIQKYDTEDPVAVGETTTYVVEVRNQGFQPITMVEVANNIPRTTKFISARATDQAGMPINFRLENNDERVVFEPVPVIDSGEKAVFKITVQALQKGDLLNTVEAKCKEFQKTIMTDEPTTAY
jgi:uncharacterized repeat protein (TIGR01451 family)